MLTNFAVNNTWFIFEETVGASDATVTLQWPASLELTGFTRSQSRVSQSSGARWTFGPLSPATGSDPYTSNKTGVTGFHAFSVLNDMVVLAVSWLTVNGENKNGDNYINWNVANERANNKYAVEYSVNGVNFSEIGIVAGKGSLSSANSYQFIHRNVIGAISYYRIKSIDADGSYSYSPIIKINNANAGAVNYFSISPNPVITHTNLEVQSSVASKVNLIIIDAAGKKINEQQISLQRGINSIPLNFTGLNPGIYYVELIGENNAKQVIKVLKK